LSQGPTKLTGMRVSPSRLKVFGDCSRQFYYQHILKMPQGEVGSLTVLGSVWHFAVQVYEEYGQNLELGLKTFDYYWDNPEKLDRGQKIDFYHPRTTHEGLRDRGHKMLVQYHEMLPWKSGTNIGSEVVFLVPIGDHELSGIIDKLWVRPRNKTLEIIDFKTGAKVPEKLRYNLQFTSYAYATTTEEFWQQVPGYEDGHERFKSYRRQGWWYHARNSKKFNAGFREEKDYRRLLLAVESMEKCIDADAFPLTVEGAACAYCPYEEICGTEVTL